MISNFKFVDKMAANLHTPEDLMNAHGGFTYAGSGTIADTDYDEIWTYTLINDGVLRQLEFWHLSSSSNIAMNVRWLINGVVSVSLTNGSSYIVMPSTASAYSYRFVRVMDGDDVVFDWFGYSQSSSSTNYITYLIVPMIPVYSEAPQARVYVSVYNGRFMWIGGRHVLGAPPSMNGSTPTVVARPHVFFSSSAGTTMWSRYLYDSTTLYAIQNPAANTIPSQDNYPFNIEVADWTEVVVNGHHFIALNMGYKSDSKEYISFFRIS